MCNQNIISNKFDLKLVTMFSSYWCTVIFTKSRSLPYVLKKQRKNWYQRDDTKETTHSKNGTQKNNVKTRKENDTHKPADHSKDLITKSQNNDTEVKNDAFDDTKENDAFKRKRHAEKRRQNQKGEWRSQTHRPRQGSEKTTGV